MDHEKDRFGARVIGVGKIGIRCCIGELFSAKMEVVGQIA